MVDPPPQVGNAYPMVTWSKLNIYKPKIFLVELRDCEPRTIDESFTFEEWKVVAH